MRALLRGLAITLSLVKRTKVSSRNANVVNSRLRATTRGKGGLGRNFSIYYVSLSLYSFNSSLFLLIEHLLGVEGKGCGRLLKVI